MKKLIPKYARLPLLLCFILNFLSYNGARFIKQNDFHFNFETFLDKNIPFLPFTAFIYIGCFFVWIINYILSVKYDKENAYKFLCADFICKIICFLIFILIPTTNTRPIVEYTGFWNNVMTFIYSVDAADNLLPSTHCLFSVLCYLGIKDIDKIPKWYRNFSLIVAILVCISTLTTKQHVILDVFVGITLAIITYTLCKKTKISKFYFKLFRFIKD